jgi:hypothetical protein
VKGDLSKSRFQFKKANWFAIRCECRAKIPLASDLAEMGQKIEKHALKHKDKETDPSKAEDVFNHIQDQLAMKVLKIVAR